jgi:glyoxylate utilization-related uncharacterized protein
MRALSGSAERLRVHEWSGDAEEGGPVVGEVVLYVARGSVELELGGKTHRLSEGDAMFFDGSTPHKLRNTGDDDTRALFVANGG